uniref:Uncharacterized protein n=1 Tax=Arundo donax TaxID=35708 RepID=A0A0A9GT15_ARUDO
MPVAPPAVLSGLASPASSPATRRSFPHGSSWRMVGSRGGPRSLCIWLGFPYHIPLSSSTSHAPPACFLVVSMSPAIYSSTNTACFVVVAMSPATHSSTDATRGSKRARGTKVRGELDRGAAET